MIVSALCLLTVVPFLLWAEQVESWIAGLDGTYGTQMLGVVIVALLTFDVVLPIPASLTSALAGAALGLIPGFAVIFIGMTLSCFVAYGLGQTLSLAGLSRLVPESRLHSMSDELQRSGVVTLIACRGVPVFAEVSVIAAGIAGFPLRQFSWAIMVPNFLIASAYSYMGHTAAETSEIFRFVLAILCVPLVAQFLRYVLTRSTIRPSGTG